MNDVAVDIAAFVTYVERKWGGGTGHTANNRWVSHAELRKHAEAFAEEQAIWRQADQQCAFDPTPNPAVLAARAATPVEDTDECQECGSTITTEKAAELGYYHGSDL